MQLAEQSLSGSDPIVTAVGWIEALVTGSMATALAVIAVAWLGFGMLRGVVSPLRVGQVLIGCFILFGAPTIARELRGMLELGAVAPVRLAPPPPPSKVQAPAAFDPYAGASMPEVEARLQVDQGPPAN